MFSINTLGEPAVDLIDQHQILSHEREIEDRWQDAVDATAAAPAPFQPAWVRRALDNALPAKDLTSSF